LFLPGGGAEGPADEIGAFDGDGQKALLARGLMMAMAAS